MTADSLVEGLRTTALGMGVVFLSLGALYSVLCQFERIAARMSEASRRRDTARSVKESSESVKKSSDKDYGQDVSHEIAAVIACVLSLEDSSGGKVKVRSVSRSNH